MKTQNIFLSILLIFLIGCSKIICDCFYNESKLGYYVHYINRTHAGMTFYKDSTCAERRCDSTKYIYIPRGGTLTSIILYRDLGIRYNYFNYLDSYIDNNRNVNYTNLQIPAIAKIGDKTVVYTQARTPTQYIDLPEEPRGGVVGDCIRCIPLPLMYMRDVGDTSIFARYTYTPYSSPIGLPSHITQTAHYKGGTIYGAIEYIFRSSDTLHYKKK